MNIFGIGTWELLLILIIALVVAGPQRMLQWAYILGRLFAQARVLWSQAMDAVQSELDQAGVDVKVPKDFSRKEISRSVSELTKPLSDEVRKVEQEYRDQIKSVESEVKSTTDEAKKEVTALDKTLGRVTRTDPKPREGAITRADRRSTARDTAPASNGNTEANTTGDGFGSWSDADSASRSDAPSSDNGETGGFGTWSTPNADAATNDED